MHLTTRLGAGVTAAVLILGLGAGTATAADEPSSRTTGVKSVDPTPTTLSRGALPADLGRPAGATAQSGENFSKIRVSSSALYQKGPNQVRVYLSGSFGTPPQGASLTSITFTLQVAGKNHAGVKLHADSEYEPGKTIYYVESQSGWGAGKAKILNTTFNYSDGSSVMDGTDSNTFYLRNLVKSTAYYSYHVTVYDPSDKIRFEPKRWVVFKPSTGTYVSLGEIRLQYKKGSGWKTMKVIKLNSKGSGSYTTNVAAKRSYRLFVPTTSTVLGGATPPSPKY